MGAFFLLTLGDWLGIEPLRLVKTGEAFVPLLGVLFVLLAVGLFKLNMHLGKPHRFYRGFYNLRLSPVSREIAGVTLFFLGLLGYTLAALFEGQFAHIMRDLRARGGEGAASL